MPYKNPEEQKEYNRTRAEQRRERAKVAQGGKPAEVSPPSAARATPPVLVKPGVALPSGQSPAAQPAPTIPATPLPGSKERMRAQWEEMKAKQDGKPVYTHRTKAEVAAQMETSGSTRLSSATETQATQAKPPIQKSLDAALALLKKQGWCLWSCNTWSDDVVCILRDRNVEGFPSGYPLAEFKKRPDGFIELVLIPGESLKPQMRLTN